MRSPGVVYRKLKEAKYQHLVELYKKHLKKSPQNCKYNYKYVFLDVDGNQKEMRICLYSQNREEGLEPFRIDLCEVLRHVQQCNAFILKNTRESVKILFEKELKDIKIKAVKYPDICALEWVLEKPAYEAGNLGFIERLLYKLKNLFTNKKGLL